MDATRYILIAVARADLMLCVAWRFIRAAPIVALAAMIAIKHIWRHT